MLNVIVPSSSQDRPTGLLPFALASKACLGSLSWGILLTWPNHLCWDLSIRRTTGLMLKDFRISELRTLFNSVTPSILRKNLILDACTCDRTLWSLPKIHDHTWERGQILFWKLRALPFLTILVSWQPNSESSNYCTSLAYSGIQFLALPSDTRKRNPKILELLDLLQCCSIHL